MRLILASTSPRRHELLSAAGMVFDVLAVHIDETSLPDEQVDDYIMRMAVTKAAHACTLLPSDVSALIITADTIGVLDGQILTKPTNKAHAYAMWAQMSGRVHQVRTAVCASVVQGGKIIHQKNICVSTDVSFITLSDAQKQSYWASGEPLDKAGAYAIQGGAMAWVRAINGSYTNVVGLPLAETVALIEQMRLIES